MKLSHFIGIAFVDEGRGFEGADCYGLIKLYFKHALKINIPEILIHPNQSTLAMAKFLLETSKNWKRHSGEPKEGYGIALRTDPLHPKCVTHFGVVVKYEGKLQMLHTFRNIESHIVPLDHLCYKNKIEGYYEWQN
jgi:hypothetical protein